MATPTTTTDSNKALLTEQTHMIRAIEASLKISVPDAEELRFRGSMLRKAAAIKDELKPAFILRLYEAACEVKFPSDDVVELRKVLQVSIAKIHGLKAYRKSA